MATLFWTDGRAEEVEPANGTRFSLAELQGFVGGFIEAVRVPDGFYYGRQNGMRPGGWMIVNEEGLIYGLKPNLAATRIAGRAIVGPAVWCSDAEVA